MAMKYSLITCSGSSADILFEFIHFNHVCKPFIRFCPVTFSKLFPFRLQALRVSSRTDKCTYYFIIMLQLSLYHLMIKLLGHTLIYPISAVMSEVFEYSSDQYPLELIVICEIICIWIKRC